MTKARTVGQKRRGRPKKDGERTESGRLKRTTPSSKAKQEAAMQTALSARIRHGAPDAEAAKLPWYGSNAGRSIASEPDVADLWQAIKTIQARRRAYLASLDAPAEWPPISPLKSESDPGAGDPPPPPDLRAEGERSQAAARAWDAILDALTATSPLLIRFIDRVVIRDEPAPGDWPLAQVLRLPKLRAALGG